MENKIEIVKTNKIERHPDVPNVRTKIIKSACADLMKSIKISGVKNPIACFKLEGDDKYYLVEGERRLSSVRWLAEENPDDPTFKEIPVIVREYGNNKEEAIKKALFDNLIENIQREDLNGYDLANRLQEMIDRGMTKEEICKAIGKSITWVNESLNFLKSNESIKEGVKNGLLTLDEGKKLAKLPEEHQEIVAKGLISAKSLGDKEAVRKIKKGTKAATSKEGIVAPSKKEISFYRNAMMTTLSCVRDKEGANDKSKRQIILGAMITALDWVLGKSKGLLDLSKVFEEFGIELDKYGNLANTSSLKKKPKKTKK
jgi:ParB/RepB/Spo0J family partition protein